MKRMLYWLVGALVFLLFFAGLVAFIRSVYRLRRIVVVSPVPLDEHFSFLPTDTLLFLDPSLISQTLISRYPFLLSASVQKVLPDTLSVVLRFSDGVATIRHGDTLQILDANGYILPEGVAVGRELPRIETELVPLSGVPPDWRIRKAVSLVSILFQTDTPVSILRIEDDSSVFRLFLSDAVEVIIPYEADAGLLAPSLQTIIHRFRIDGKSIRSIDFRFEKPVVVIKNEK